jgi:UDP-N-acetylmuramyl pentapeptide phosphotransferase/UDP-N-acetylglucosamine-1-phosphate transferase
MNPEIKIYIDNLTLFKTIGIAFITSIVLILLIIKLNKVLNIYDIPDERKIHKYKTPTLGGIGIIGALIIAYILTGKYYISVYFWLSLFILFITGILDDVKGLRWHQKLLLQTLSAVIFISTGFNYSILFQNPLLSFVPVFIQPVLIGILIVLYINSFNLIDGMDGLAGGIAIINFSILGIFNYYFGNNAVAWVCFALVGSLLGFLVFNTHPAKIFMGDTGSMSLGFLLVMVSFYTYQFYYHIPDVQITEKYMFLWVIGGVLFLPFADAVRVFFSRIINKKLPYMPGKDHIHHILNRSGLSQKNTVLLLYGINLLFVLTGIIIYLNKPLSLIVSVLLLKI